MNDRLKELKNFQQHDDNNNNNNNNNLKASQIDLESQNSDGSQSEALVSKQFKTDIASARALIEKIKANTEDIQNLKTDYSQATRVAKEKEISEQITMNLSDNRKHTQQLKRLMDNLSEDIQQTKLDKDRQGDAFVKQNLYNSISTAAKQVLLDSQSAQEDYRQGLKTKTTRQVKHFAPEMTDEQIEQIAEDPDSIQELHQLMLDIATMVQVQGEIIDNIEINVNIAQKNVVKANENLTTAKKHHISARKKQCCLLVIAVVIIAIILGTTLG